MEPWATAVVERLFGDGIDLRRYRGDLFILRRGVYYPGELAC